MKYKTPYRLQPVGQFFNAGKNRSAKNPKIMKKEIQQRWEIELTKIEKAMAEKGITNYRLAKITGLSQSTIGRILRKDGNPNVGSYLLIIDALGVD